jgi:hypothetical protein
MRTLCGVALAALLLGLGGCGDGKKQDVDTKPFEAAIVEYLRVNSMGMKPDKFESIEVTGDKATAKVRMATADDLYGMKPLWTIEFARQGDKWVVTNTER